MKPLNEVHLYTGSLLQCPLVLVWGRTLPVDSLEDLHKSESLSTEELDGEEGTPLSVVFSL